MFFHCAMNLGRARAATIRIIHTDTGTVVSAMIASSGEIVNITWNSNPYKPQNRELLDPQVKKALSMCVDVNQIKQVVFSGYAAPEASLLGTIAGDWRSPNVKPVP